MVYENKHKNYNYKIECIIMHKKIESKDVAINKIDKSIKNIKMSESIAIIKS